VADARSLLTLVLAGAVKANTIDRPRFLTIYRTDGVTIHAQIPPNHAERDCYNLKLKVWLISRHSRVPSGSQRV
jgi:hypothetical protein